MQIDWLQLLLQLGALGLLAFLLERLTRAGSGALSLFAQQLNTWQAAMVDSARVLEAQAQLLRQLIEDHEAQRSEAQAQLDCTEALCNQIKEAESSMRQASASHEEKAQERHLQIMALISQCPRCRGPILEGSEIMAKDEP